jgi:zinc protease
MRRPIELALLLVLAGVPALSVAGCGSAPPTPREYTRLPPAEGTSAERSIAESPPPEPEREPLRDGPRLIVQRDASAILTFRVAFDAGSGADDAGREGITLLTALSMVEGGAGELSYAELTERLYPMAASIDVHVGRDQTVFIGQVHRDHVEEFYELYRDVLLRPRLGEPDFARVRDRVRNELTVDLRSAQDEQLGKEALEGLLYQGHPFAHPVLGTEEGLARLRVDDVRAHRRRVFCAGRATIGLAGDLPAELAARVERDVSALRGEACVGREVLPPPANVDEPRMLIVRKPSSQAVAVSMGFPTDVSREAPDYPALVLAGAWLGQHRQFVGRLMQSIRGQRGLNYGDYAYVEHFTQDGSSRFPLVNDVRRQQYFSIWLRPLRPETAHFAIRAAVRELRRLHSQGLTQEDLDRIRGFADAYFALYLQTSSRRLGFAMDDAFYGAEGAYLERMRAAWRSLTLEEVNDAIRRHLNPSRLQIAAVASDAEALAQAIATEAESPITYRSAVPEAVLREDRDIARFPLRIARDRITIVPIDAMFAR